MSYITKNILTGIAIKITGNYDNIHDCYSKDIQVHNYAAVIGVGYVLEQC